LDPLIKIYGGKVEMLIPKQEAYQYIIFRKKELLNLVNNYLVKYPLKTHKHNRVSLIKKFFSVSSYRKSNDILKYNE
jgi:hypothetical protein